jgi:hypothetical protein
MIYSQGTIFYIIAICLTLLVGVRLQAYLKEFFTSGFSLLVTITILLHPLSIDAFLAPNPIGGPLAFYIFLEGLFMLRKEKFEWAILLMILASIFNFAYCVFPLFFFFKHRATLKKYLVPVLLYAFIGFIYFKKHFLNGDHNPIIFYSLFFQNLLIPMSLSVIDYSVFPFNPMSTALSIVFILLFCWREQYDKRSRSFWPMLLFPIFGLTRHQWTEAHHFWDDVILTSSNSLCITFAFIVMLAIHLPKKIFALYVVVILLFSYDWAQERHPYSKVLEESIVNLPADYPEIATVKRVLAWQYLYENKKKKGSDLLNALSRENTKDKNLLKDLEVLKNAPPLK